MKVRFHRQFERQYKVLSTKRKKRVKERLALFLQDEFNPILNNHPLRGKYRGYRSFNITGDLRAIYTLKKSDMRILIALGTHRRLYK